MDIIHRKVLQTMSPEKSPRIQGLYMFRLSGKWKASCPKIPGKYLLSNMVHSIHVNKRMGSKGNIET